MREWVAISPNCPKQCSYIAGRDGIFWTAKKGWCYIANNRAALDHEYARPKYHLFNACMRKSVHVA